MCLADFEPGETLVELPCAARHLFHPHCAHAALSRSVHCPLCRVDVRPALVAPTPTAPVAPLYLVIVVGTIVASIVFALGVLFGKCQGRKGRQKVVTTATRSKPGAGMEMTSVAPDSGLKTGDGIVDGARVVD